MKSLDSKVAFVTGAAQGLGESIALQLAKAGAKVVVADLDVKNGEKVVAKIKALGRSAIAIQLDVTDECSVKEAVRESIDHFKKVDILVNNAGVFFADEESEKFDLHYQVNVRGVWQVITAFTQNFKAIGGGKIVNIASINGRRGYQPSTMAYNASKAAVINLTQSFAMALGPDNINVNAICPGAVKTPMTERARAESKDPNWEKYAKEHTQLKRPVTPEDIGQAVVFFVSTQSKNITGQALNVDGGHFMN